MAYDGPLSARSDCLEMRSVRIGSPTSIDIEMNDQQFYDEFTPVMGKFGAPRLRCTPSLVSLLAICAGMVVTTIGCCLLVFFTQEALFIPPGITLSCIGLLLFLLGCIFWSSELMCNDCLSTCFEKIQEQPMKNAIKRREQRAKSAASRRTGSRVSINSRASRVTMSTEGGGRY